MRITRGRLLREVRKCDGYDTGKELHFKNRHRRFRGYIESVPNEYKHALSRFLQFPKTISQIRNTYRDNDKIIIINHVESQLHGHHLFNTQKGTARLLSDLKFLRSQMHVLTLARPG